MGMDEWCYVEKRWDWHGRGGVEWSGGKRGSVRGEYVRRDYEMHFG